MEILSHRGYWKTDSEKNTLHAFVRSWELGFGLETDIRDYQEKLVISHDVSDEHSLLFKDFLERYKIMGNELPLAFNIKADGLQPLLSKILENFQIENYFFFDMSIPETLNYFRHNLPTYIRVSEYEDFPKFYKKSQGIWLDSFEKTWFTKADLLPYLEQGKTICLVSPELHKRPHLPLWLQLKEWDLAHHSHLQLCTDFPEQARSFFHD